jgi:hypothetical protein
MEIERACRVIRDGGERNIPVFIWEISTIISLHHDYRDVPAS